MSELLSERIARLKSSGDADAKTDEDGELVELLHARIAELEAAGRLAIEAWRRSPSVGYDLTEAMVRLGARLRQVEEQ